jgi:hypothetical protein
MLLLWAHDSYIVNAKHIVRRLHGSPQADFIELAVPVCRLRIALN